MRAFAAAGGVWRLCLSAVLALTLGLASPLAAVAQGAGESGAPEIDPASILDVSGAQAALAAVEQARAGLSTQWAQRDRECRGRVLVNACLADLDAERRARESRLKAVEIRARTVLREDRALRGTEAQAERDERMRQEADAQQERSSEAAEARAAREAARAQREDDRARGEADRALRSAEAVRRRAEREAAAARRQEDAERRAREAPNRAAERAQRVRLHEEQQRARQERMNQRAQRRVEEQTGRAQMPSSAPAQPASSSKPDGSPDSAEPR